MNQLPRRFRLLVSFFIILGGWAFSVTAVAAEPHRARLSRDLAEIVTRALA